MAERVVQEARYVIQQFEGDLLAHEEFVLDEHTTSRDEAIARAAFLESQSPLRKTTWYLQGAITETMELPGTVVEQDVSGGTVFDIVGADAVRAELGGVSLPLRFYAADVQPDDVVQFFDDNGELVAELTL